MKFRLLIFSIIGACMVIPASAQSIHPTVQSIKTTGEPINVGGGFSLQNVKDADPVALQSLQSLISQNKKGIKLYIGELGDKSLSKFTPVLPSISGAYYLSVNKKEVAIIGYDGRGTYYGVQTFRQLLEGGNLASVEIIDYPEIKFRGSVEGFYGNPWSHRDRLSQLKFYGENKLNTYIYGPKDDPYHSSLSGHSGVEHANAGWRVPYPAAEAKNIKELAETAKQYKVDFVWAIHPGADIKWNEDDYQNLLNKFEHVYELGVRSFAVFFDDISGEGANAHKQASLLNRINSEFVQLKGDVTPLILCPTEYNKSWANSKPDGYLPILGKELDPSVQIMWTGDRVCADITMETLTWINQRINRPTYIWWNFPVTDYIRDKVLQGPSYGLDTLASAKDMSGFVSNPMENAEASKIALYGVADYTWNPKAYKYIPTWDQAIKVIMPQASDAYRTFAIHSSDLEQNGHGYRRDESWETTVIDPLNYTQVDYNNLRTEFEKIVQVPSMIFATTENSYLIEELSPWLIQFGILGNRGLQVMDLIELNTLGNHSSIWDALLECEMSTEELSAYNKHKSGTTKLRPFISNSRSTIATNLYDQISGKTVNKATPITSFSRTETLSEMLDNNSSTYFYSWGGQKVGDWVGVDLGSVQPVSNILIEQGRKFGDRDYIQCAKLEYSTDFENWTILQSISDSTYTITYNSKPIEARYIRLRATEGTSNKNWTAIRRFDINPLQSQAIVMTNIPQVSSNQPVTEGAIISLKPMLELVKVAPKCYLGIELPLISLIKSVNIDLGNKAAKVEYSNDGIEWNTVQPTSARFIRFINNSTKDIEIKLNKFQVELSAVSGGDIMNIFDNDLTTGFSFVNPLKIAIPINTKRMVIFAQQSPDAKITMFDIKGNILKSEPITNSLTTFDLPQDIVEVEISGSITIREVILKH